MGDPAHSTASRLLAALDAADRAAPWTIEERDGGFLVWLLLDTHEWAEVAWVSRRLASEDLCAAVRVILERASLSRQR